jgi:hypothetical protein
MDNQDRHNTITTMVNLEATSEWTIWKTRDKELSGRLQPYKKHVSINSSTYTKTNRRNDGD